MGLAWLTGSSQYPRYASGISSYTQQCVVCSASGIPSYTQQCVWCGLPRSALVCPGLLCPSLPLAHAPGQRITYLAAFLLIPARHHTSWGKLLQTVLANEPGRGHTDVAPCTMEGRKKHSRSICVRGCMPSVQDQATGEGGSSVDVLAVVLGITIPVIVLLLGIGIVVYVLHKRRNYLLWHRRGMPGPGERTTLLVGSVRCVFCISACVCSSARAALGCLCVLTMLEGILGEHYYDCTKLHSSIGEASNHVSFV